MYRKENQGHVVLSHGSKVAEYSQKPRTPDLKSYFYYTHFSLLPCFE